MASPLSKYNSDNRERWEVLVDFPAWEVAAILTWIKRTLHERGYDQWSNAVAVFNPTVLPAIQRGERIMLSDLGLDISDWAQLRPSLSRMINEDSEKALLFVELLIKYVRDYKGLNEYCDFGVGTDTGKNILNLLERLLSNGSKWKIVMKQGATAGLIERVNPKYQEIAEALGNKELDQAWYDAFGPDAKPGQAIVNAQQAIELASSQSGLTKVRTNVYGRLLGDIRTNLDKSYLSIAKPEFDVTLSLTNKADGTSVLPAALIDQQYGEWFWKGMDLIQKSNPARHKSDGVNDFEVSAEAARQAVLIATLLCELITKKYIYKR